MDVLILGCGWVGTIFAEKLIQQGCKVFASTTSPQKVEPMQEAGMTPYLIDFNNPALSRETFLSTMHFDLVLISVPAKRREEYATCADKFKRLSSFVENIHASSIVYLSSVGIYPATGQLIHEMDIPAEQLDKKLYQAEQTLLQQVKGLNILRLGGIFGYNRIPGKHFSNKTCPVADQRANYIHADDIFEIVMAIYRTKTSNQLFNAVSPHHPTKKEVILKMSTKYNFALPSSFEDVKGPDKTVSSKKLVDILAYRFLYPNPIDY